MQPRFPTTRSPTIRPFTPADAAATSALFYDSIHGGAQGAYTPEQLTAWAPEPPSVDDWAARLSAMTTLIAVQGAEVVGFMSLEGGGHIDRAFVHPDHLRTGVASALYQGILVRARKAGMAELTADASIVAKPFFEKQGWQVVATQHPMRNGVALTNYRMRCAL
jgi:putative acetyltransferase